MKRLLVLRHAKSSWSDSSLSDFDRPLNDRGRAAAPFMGEMIAKNKMIPDLIVSSPAQRALQTATLIRASSGTDMPLILNDQIYEASPQALKSVVASIDDEVCSAMLVGHNPGIEGFIRYLTGILEPMPTAALAVIDLDIDSWAAIGADSGNLINTFRPKELMQSTKPDSGSN